MRKIYRQCRWKSRKSPRPLNLARVLIGMWKAKSCITLTSSDRKLWDTILQLEIELTLIWVSVLHILIFYKYILSRYCIWNSIYKSDRTYLLSMQSFSWIALKCAYLIEMRHATENRLLTIWINWRLFDIWSKFFMKFYQKLTKTQLLFYYLIDLKTLKYIMFQTLH